MNAAHSVVIWQDEFSVDTPGRGTSDLSSSVAERVARSGIKLGTAHIYLRHTSASLMLCENADPDVQRDLETWMSAHVIDGDPRFSHDAEGPDDMAAHVRTMLCGSDLTVPVRRGQLALGTWQGIYLWEHRSAAHRRNIVLTVTGLLDD